MAIATSDPRIVIISGLAATFAESISMAAVAFTSQKAAKQFYESELLREQKEIEEVPETEKKEIRKIFEKKGFGGKDLERVVEVITSNKKVWLQTVFIEELNLGSYTEKKPIKGAIEVEVSAFAGTLVPLAPFFFLPVSQALVVSFVFSISVLFAAGFFKAKITVGNWFKNGLEMALIGTLAAIAGFVIGLILK